MVLIPLYGGSFEWASVIVGLFVLGSQALGYGVSSACFGFIQWLGSNVVGIGVTHDIFSTPIHAWQTSCWVFPVSSIIALVTAWLTCYVIGWVRMSGFQHAATNGAGYSQMTGQGYPDAGFSGQSYP